MYGRPALTEESVQLLVSLLELGECCSDGGGLVLMPPQDVLHPQEELLHKHKTE